MVAKLSPTGMLIPLDSSDNSLALHLYSGPWGWLLKTKQLGARAYGVTRLLNNIIIMVQLNNDGITFYRICEVVCMSRRYIS